MWAYCLLSFFRYLMFFFTSINVRLKNPKKLIVENIILQVSLESKLLIVMNKDHIKIPMIGINDDINFFLESVMLAKIFNEY